MKKSLSLLVSCLICSTKAAAPTRWDISGKLDLWLLVHLVAILTYSHYPFTIRLSVHWGFVKTIQFKSASFFAETQVK